jgi:hypothetical protein
VDFTWWDIMELLDRLGAPDEPEDTELKPGDKVEMDGINEASGGHYLAWGSCNDAGSDTAQIRVCDSSGNCAIMYVRQDMVRKKVKK